VSSVQCPVPSDDWFGTGHWAPGTEMSRSVVLRKAEVSNCRKVCGKPDKNFRFQV